MRIGINAGILTGDFTGMARYTISLLVELVQTDHELFVYLPSDANASILPAGIHSVRSSVFKTRIGKKIWEQLILPYWLLKDDVDVLWSPSHHLPRFVPKKIAKVLTVHDLVWVQAPNTMRLMNRLSETLLMPLSIKSADQIIAVSTQTSFDLERFVPESKNKTNIIYCGVTKFDKKAVSTDVLLKFDLPYALFVGTLEPRKNLERLLNAYSGLSIELKRKYILVIVGGAGWGGLEINRLIKQLDISENIKVMGYVSDFQLKKLYEEATLLALPSLYEGFGLPLLEAMSVGVPVLTSKLSSMPEVVSGAAILVDPYDVDSISNGLTSLLVDKGLRQELSIRGKKRSLELSWESASKKTLKVFEQAIELNKYI